MGKIENRFQQFSEIPFQALDLKKLARSIAPDIFGLDRVKEVLLL